MALNAQDLLYYPFVICFYIIKHSMQESKPPVGTVPEDAKYRVTPVSWGLSLKMRSAALPRYRGVCPHGCVRNEALACEAIHIAGNG